MKRLLALLLLGAMLAGFAGCGLRRQTSVEEDRELVSTPTPVETPVPMETDNGENDRGAEEVSAAPAESETPEENAAAEWKQAYIDYINTYGKGRDPYNSEIYKLVNINNDSIPELYIDFNSTAGGSVICTYHNGQIAEQRMWSYGLSYIEGQNIFCNSGGHMDEYFDEIYSIENGQFVLLARGDYGATDNSRVQLDDNGNPIYNYYWNNTAVSSETEYSSLLNTAYNTQQATSPFDGAEYSSTAERYVGNGLCNYSEIIDAIQNY